MQLPIGSTVVGIDLGGSKTHLACGFDGVATDERIVATPSWRTTSVTDNAAALAGLVREAWGAGALEVPLGVGAHGCDSTEECRELARALAVHFTGPVRVVNDGELLPWAASQPGGIGVVVGTGSIAVCRDEQDQLLRAGGWGWLLGDEGSSAGLIRESVRAVLYGLDEGLQADALGRRLMAAFGATDGPQLAMALSRNSSAPGWGLHAPEVFSAAEEGSVLARHVITDAGIHLSRLIAQLRGRGVTTRHVVAGGGVIVGQPLLRSAFAAALTELEPDTTLTILSEPPVRGALVLAQSAAQSAAQSVAQSSRQPDSTSISTFTASEASA